MTKKNTLFQQTVIPRRTDIQIPAFTLSEFRNTWARDNVQIDVSGGGSATLTAHDPEVLEVATFAYTVRILGNESTSVTPPKPVDP